MSKEDISNELIKLVKKAQIDEEQGAILYEFMAKREKNEENKKLLEQMAKDEGIHAKVWKEFSNKDIKPNKLGILWFKLLTVFMGFTFVIKTMQKKESLAQAGYEKMSKELPEAARILEDERRHEKELYNMIDEERLNLVKKESIIIDLASNPGGVDRKSAREKGLKVIWALSLPGKVAPLTSAEFIKETLDNVLKELK